MGITINDDLISKIDEFNSLSQKGISDSELEKQLSDIERLAQLGIKRDGNKPAHKILKAITLFKQLRKLAPEDLHSSQLQITTKAENPGWFSWNLATRVSKAIAYHTGYGPAPSTKDASVRTFSQSLVDIVEKEKKRPFSTAPKILTKQAFQDQLSKTFRKDLSSEALSSAVAQAFHLHTPELKTKDKAKMILTAIFACHGFDFASFKGNDEKRFLIALLNGIYYGEYHPAKVSLESFVFQIFAESADQKTVEARLKELPLDQKLFLISSCLSHYREGSFLILKFLETQSPDLYQLIQGLRRKYYNNEALRDLIPGKSLESILSTLEKLAKKESAATYQAFCRLGENQGYTEEQVDQFFKVFGFDYPLNPDNHFITRFFAHLQAFSDPAKLQKGMDRLTVALPTNKDISELAWLPSVAKGLSTIIGHTGKAEFPIIVIDQSNKETFEKNREYIERLNQDPKGSLNNKF